MTAIYIHYPFCKSKCPYCDFNSHIKTLEENVDFLEEYKKELEYYFNILGKRKITSIFFGGGTPSLMSIELIEGILDKIYNLFEIEKNIEITLEANPTSLEIKAFSLLRGANINRLSIGIQALNDRDLSFLGREHNTKNAILALESAQKYFKNFSFDLIYSRPNQSIIEWRNELNNAFKIGSPHLSLYQLTIEKGTKFYSEFQKKKFSLPSEDMQNQLYDVTAEICNKYGLDIYEVSNYAKKNYHSRHNMNYWQYGDYIGIGAGAHSRYYSKKKEKIANMNYHLPKKWQEEVQKNGNAIQASNKLEKKDILQEILMMGLRTKFGIKTEILQKYFQKDLFEIFDKQKLDDLVKEGLIKYDKKFLAPTIKGIKMVNSIYHYLVLANIPL